MGPESPPRFLPPKADFALITAIEKEQESVNVALEAVKSAFGLSRDAIKKNGTDYFYGWIQSKTNRKKEHFVVCARCVTIGNQASQALATAVLADWDPAYILLVGTAGGVKRQYAIKPCDIVVSSTIAYDKKKQTSLGWEVYAQPVKTPSAKLLKAANHIVDLKIKWWESLGKKPIGDNQEEPKIVSEQIISGEDLRGDAKADELAFLLKAFPQAIAVEMEAGGVGFALWDKESRTNFTVVKGVTDLVNVDRDKNQETRDLCRSYAAQAAATLALSIVQNME
jgi:nucleoside phosphorylase